MFPYTKLFNESIVLRPFEFGEEAQLYEAVHSSLKELNPWMSWANENYTQDVAKNFISVTRAEWSRGTLYGFAIADVKTNQILGGCSLSHIHPVYRFCNLGYWVKASHHGRGIASNTAKLAARFAFEKLNIIRAEIVIAIGNEASKRVAEKIGAHYEGILLNRMTVGKNIYDAHMFSLLPKDFGLVASI